MKSSRLTAIANYVEGSNYTLDVGTDHAYLPIYLIENNLAKKCLASDINLEPCKVAQKNIKEKKLNDRIEVVQSDGLELLSDDVDTVTISGMGGNLIASMIETAFESITDQKFILQPNNNSYKLRKFLISKGYKITNECLVEDNDIIYEVIEVQKGVMFLDETELYFGPLILKNKKINDLFYRKYIAELEYIKNTLDVIPEPKRIHHPLSSRYNMLKEVIDEY